MDLTSEHAANEEKARLALEVMEFRRELAQLAVERDDFVRSREKEAMEAAQRALEAASDLLSEVSDAVKAADSWSKAVSNARKELAGARREFREWRDAETARISDAWKLIEAKSAEMREAAALLAKERQLLEAATEENRATSELSRRDFEEARQERAKLASNRKELGIE